MSNSQSENSSVYSNRSDIAESVYGYLPKNYYRPNN